MVENTHTLKLIRKKKKNELTEADVIWAVIPWSTTCLKIDVCFKLSSVDGVGVGARYPASDISSKSPSKSFKTLSSVGNVLSVGIEYSASSNYN